MLLNLSEPEYLGWNYRNTMVISVWRKFLVTESKLLTTAKYFGMIC